MKARFFLLRAPDYSENARVFDVTNSEDLCALLAREAHPTFIDSAQLGDFMGTTRVSRRKQESECTTG